MDALAAALLPHDILRVAGLSYVENAYTNLIAWAFDPSTSEAAALQAQRAWLASIPGLARRSIVAPARPVPQFVTEGGVPDLLLDYGDWVLLVEAKTGSAEHATPLGGKQTIDYPKAAREALAKDSQFPVEIVLIAPELREPANPDAFSGTYVQLAVALASMLSTVPLPDELRWTYRVLVTHFVGSACPWGSRMLEVRPREWLDDAARDGDHVLLGHIEVIQLWDRVLPQAG
ncbi:MAG: hypothetical protein HY744_25640 [Deltaproteobacteria bacterium]|nr:hypothetical protein [Deltaproteobacteria bacterium]